jgi:molybdate transport system permease protein
VTLASSRGRALLRTGVLTLAALATAFLLLPLLGLALSLSPADLVAGLTHPLAAAALRLSLTTTSVSLLLVLLFGTPLAWLLARSHGPLARTVGTLVQLPVVVPPAVAGLALLLAFGRRGLLGRLLPEGMSPSFSTGAVVLAEAFVSGPFYVAAASEAFRRLDASLLHVARSLGAGPVRLFVRVVLPLAAPGLVAGAAMAWARALGEFGATLMFAGNLPGVTQTLPLAVYTAMEADVRVAQALALVLVTVALVLLLAVRGRGLGLRGGEGWGAP